MLMRSAGRLWHPADHLPVPRLHPLDRDTEGASCPVSCIGPIPELQEVCILHPMVFAFPPVRLCLPSLLPSHPWYPENKETGMCQTKVPHSCHSDPGGDDIVAQSLLCVKQSHTVPWHRDEGEGLCVRDYPVFPWFILET